MKGKFTLKEIIYNALAAFCITLLLTMGIETTITTDLVLFFGFNIMFNQINIFEIERK